MARQKGMLNLSGNLEPLAGAPLDSRDITPTVADLYIASNWPYKYIGMKTTVTATGDTYRLVNLDVTQESSWVKEGSESGQTIQYDELPAASSALAGKIYQYTGVTNVQYTNGYFYECVNDGGTYKWVQTNTQPGTSYSDFTGATSQAAGAHGLVPAPTTGDISKFLKGDGTWATVPMPSFDYSNTSPEAMNFSTDEKVIGTWIDGKPLYQKVVNLGSASGSGYIKLQHGISNIDKVVDYTPQLRHDNGNVQNLTHVEINYFSIWYTKAEDCFTVYKDGDYWNNIPIYVTVRYTKTTDTAVASGEKIVGQWIDGKPVFEKIISSTLPTTTGSIQNKAVSTGVLIDTLVYSYGVIHYESSDGFTPLNVTTEPTENRVVRYTIYGNNSQSNANKILLYNSNATWSNAPVTITMRYTKTT